MRVRWMVTLSVGVAFFTILVFFGSSGQAQQQVTGADWPMYRHDQAGTGASPLTQITTANVASLKEAWTFSLNNAPVARGGAGGSDTIPTPGRGGGGGGANSEATPIVVNGVMYLPTANSVVALDPETGQEIWRHQVTGGAPSRRGVAYWPGAGAASPPRIIFMAGRRLMAINAATGAPETSFGKDGEVDIIVPFNSVPLVYKNNVVVGANTPPGPLGAPGNARAFDARTGAKLWEFVSVPPPGEVGHDTWEGDSWKDRSGVNAWPFYFTLDQQRDILYLPFAQPIGGAYGGDRKGANLFGNSVVAVDVNTGKYKWHFQTIHHDLWDADPPAPPGLFDIVQNGRTIPALGLTTKSGYLYILNRETGAPIFGVEERPVPKSDVPTELAYPTQPFPVKPPPLSRVAYTRADLVTAADTTPEHVKACSDLIEASGGVYNAGPFTPWLYRPDGAAPSATKTTLVFPGMLGGANWGGTAFDRASGYVFVVTQDDGALGWMVKQPAGSPVPYDKTSGPGRGRGNFDVPMPGGAWPCTKPPWGRLTAVNTSTGDIAWQIPLGITETLPEAKQNTGRPALAGAIVTGSGVLFVASTDDNRFRALEAKSGRQLWVTKLARRGNADPMTYQGRRGKQYVAVVATDTLVVYALP